MTPTEVREEILRRRQLLIKANESKALQERIIEACAKDPVLWFNDWCWTFDPRNSARGLPVLMPFRLFPRQVEYILWRRERLAKREFGDVPKARDSGISYLNCGDHTHHFIFDYGYVGGLASRKEMLVDRLGDPGSLFEKIRSILKYLPSWMKPGKKAYFDGYMKLLNHEKGNAITGEAGLNIGRGNRYLLLDIDEYAFLENQDSVAAAVSQSADCVIKTSTPNGSGNLFAQECLNETNPVFYFRWTSDDRKNKWIHPETGQSGQGADAPPGAIYPWYEDQKKKLSPITIAQEIDIDFNASCEGIVIPAKWVEAAINFPIQVQSDYITAGLDVATEGRDHSVYLELSGGCKVTHIESWKGQNTTETSHRAINLCHNRRVSHLFFDVVGVGAGVAATLSTTPNLRFRFTGIHGGETPSDYYWPAENRSSKDKFHNKRAELWWLLRERFFRTWEVKNGIAKHDPSTLISIPNDQTLITQLSQPLHKFTSAGKILIESKDDMKKRGVKSPDRADALVYATATPHLTEFRTTQVVW